MCQTDGNKQMAFSLRVSRRHFRQCPTVVGFEVSPRVRPQGASGMILGVDGLLVAPAGRLFPVCQADVRHLQ